MVQNGVGRCGKQGSSPFEVEEKTISEDDIIYPKVRQNKRLVYIFSTFNQFVNTTTTTTTKPSIPNKLGLARNETQYAII
jgi:hypothetical protein